MLGRRSQRSERLVKSYRVSAMEIKIKSAVPNLTGHRYQQLSFGIRSGWQDGEVLLGGSSRHFAIQIKF